ncbi:hypothetical protein SP38_253 [Salmonella phage 38]|uniref:Uncharacterized protein n=1 Tax=Salmonella phage 38 TaxID=1654891 RepID=A0A0N7CCY6_9CAUD|nr:hypothetical protein SP38_253 [Salmonella phage 38]AKJ73855.1 hypothetical protein SP38_253 [Salmonella phage 38]
MKSFQDFLEDSSAPATTTADVGKPEGGMVKEPVKKPKILKKSLILKDLWQHFKDLDLSKARKWNFRTGQYDD